MYTNLLFFFFAWKSETFFKLVVWKFTPHGLYWAWYRIQIKMMLLSTSKTNRFCVWNKCIEIFGKKIVIITLQSVTVLLSIAWKSFFILCLLPFYVNIMCLLRFLFLLLWRKKQILYTFRDDSLNIIKFTSFNTSTIVIVLVCWLIIVDHSAYEL